MVDSTNEDVDAFLFLPADALLLISTTGVVVYADRSAGVFFAQPTSALTGVRLTALWPELDVAVGDIAVGGIAQWSHTRCGHVDIEVRRGERSERVRLFATDDGIGAAILADNRDEDTVSQTNALFHRVLESMSEPVLITTAEPLDSPGPITVFVNDAIVGGTGYTRAELLGRSPRVLQGPNSQPEARRSMHDSLRKWRATSEELVNYRKDGQEFIVNLNLSPVTDPGGWFTHWVSVQRDVTAARQEEQERESRRAIVQGILDSLPAQTVMLDSRGHILEVNASWRRQWCAHSGLPEPDWQSFNYLDALRRAAAEPELVADAQTALSGIESVLAHERAECSFDYELPAADGSRWYHMQAIALAGNSGVVITHVDITTHKVAEAELGYQATHDPLTGLPNRSLLLTRLNDELAHARTSRSRVATVFIDLDDFKDVNDAFGHDLGDHIITTVAQRLSAQLEPNDFIARLGGDEYVLVRPNIDQDWDPAALFSRLRDVINEPISLDITNVKISASMGLVTSPPHTGDAKDVLRDADTAMYVSKRSGRDQWTAFDDRLRRRAMARLITSERVERALANHEFLLHYQPIVDLHSGRTVASEALLRWHDPEQGLLYPDAFLPALETSPLMSVVGAWVVAEALATQSRWQRQPGFEDHQMTVNVSPRQVGRGELLPALMTILDRHDVPPDRLTIEILEESLVQTGASAEAEITAIHELGVKVAIDDFGTGYSSVAYLQQFPVDILKIDKAFLRARDRARTQRMMRAIGELAHAVGALSLVEGVETDADLALAIAAGVDYAQGYLLARPASAGISPAVSQTPFSRPTPVPGR